MNSNDPVCGNGITEGDEECDDGNNVDGDGCSSTCNIESGGGGNDPVCGNGITEGDEECDDGNNVDGDGCSSLCEDEGSEENGDIVINEIMYDPSAVTDANGEWFEVYNTTDSDIELEGCVISDNDGDSHTIEDPLTVLANGYAVLVKDIDPLVNGGVTSDYAYSGFSLTNTADEIILTCNSIEIDRVEYDEGNGWLEGAGASIILNDPLNDNNIGSNWCVSTTSYGDGDLGTPGVQNDSCNGQCSDTDGDGVCDDIDNCPNTPNPDQEDTDSDGIGDVCEEPDPVCVDNDSDGYFAYDETNCPTGNDCNDDDASINPGAAEVCDDQIDNNCDGEIDEGCEGGDDPVASDIIINEVAWMGTDISTGDEWVELRNMTDEEILLDGWTLNAQDGTPSIALEGSISANGYYLLERTNDDTVLDITADKIYTGALGDTGEFLELRKADDILVDEVDSSGGWLAGNGTVPKHPMERCVDDGWYDSDIAGGTPRAENSCSGICSDTDGDGVCDDIDNCPNTPNPDQEDTDSDGIGDVCEEPDPVCVDNDSDGYFAYDETNCPTGNDCNDDDASINPGAAEVCDDQIDNNCDGEIDEGCSGDNLINAGDMVINELMWTGSFKRGEEGEEVGGNSDEWIELKNTTSSELDLGSCHLTRVVGGVGKLMLSFPEGSLIEANGFYLISNYNEEDSSIGIEPNLVNTAVSLSNSALQIKLYCGDWNNEENLVDTAGDGSTPLAGDNGDDENPKKSMSRIAVPGNGSSAENWYTALTAAKWDDEATEWGTPDGENSM